MDEGNGTDGGNGAVIGLRESANEPGENWKKRRKKIMSAEVITEDKQRKESSREVEEEEEEEEEGGQVSERERERERETVRGGWRATMTSTGFMQQNMPDLCLLVYKEKNPCSYRQSTDCGMTGRRRSGIDMFLTRTRNEALLGYIYHESTRQNGERERERERQGGREREVRGEKRAKSKSQTIITKKRRGGKEERGKGEEREREREEEGKTRRE